MASQKHYRRMRRSTLIWVDANVSSDSSDTKKTIDKLHELVDEVELIRTPAQCIELLNEVGPSKCYVIISGSLGKDLVPQIHSIPHLESIFVFCGNKSSHEEWIKRWSKIRGAYTVVQFIYDELKPILKQVRNDEIAMSIIPRDDDDRPDVKKLPPSFMYSSMLKDVFFDMKFEKQHKEDLINKLLQQYTGNKRETEIIDEFKKNYRPEKAIWWYTRECFTYIKVNQGLRDLNGDIIVDMAFFIVDIHKQIKQLYDEQLPALSRVITVYRGQDLLQEELQKLKQSKNSLLSFNCFLSTSKKSETSIGFAKGGAERPGCIGILFAITVDTSLHAVPFADIQENSYYKDEAEVLFSMHAIFKIGHIEELSGHKHIYQVQLELTDEDDPKLLELKKYMAEQYGGGPGHRLGRTLNAMGQYDKAEEIYLQLLNTTKNERDKGAWSHQLGVIKDKQGKYQEALEYYQRALEIYRGILSEDDPEMATTYNCIGSVHNNMGQYSKALTSYEKSLEIKRRTLPDNHPSLAAPYNNMGLVYDKMGEYSKALINYEKSLQIMKNTLPKNHPDIATSYTCLGVLFYHMKKYAQALEYLEEARQIRMISLPPAHHLLKLTNDWVEKVKRQMK